MLDQVFDKVSRFNYGSMEDGVKEVLWKTWRTIALPYVCEYLQRRRPYESITGNDICKVELRADDVRAAVYANIQLMEKEYPDIVSGWFDLSIEEQDRYLTESFPGCEVYGV